MKSLQKIVLVAILSSALSAMNELQAQHEIKPVADYSPQIGIMVDMLEELKDRIVASVRDLDQEETDYLFDERANSIGAIIMHLAATESYCQVETLEGRMWTEEEALFWSVATGLGEHSREQVKGKPISYYLNLWDEVRAKTLAGLKAKDDAWLASQIDESMNYHWAWFHILEHTANHMGQIGLVKSRMPQEE